MPISICLRALASGFALEEGPRVERPLRSDVDFLAICSFKVCSPRASPSGADHVTSERQKLLVWLRPKLAAVAGKFRSLVGERTEGLCEARRRHCLQCVHCVEPHTPRPMSMFANQQPKP